MREAEEDRVEAGTRAVMEVVPGVHVAISRTMSTTSTVISAGGEALLIDPSWHADELAGLAGWIGAQGLTVRTGFATHAHHDHLLWHPGFGDAPRWASADTVRLAGEHREELVAQMGEAFPTGLGALLGRLAVAEDHVPGTPAGLTAELLIHDGHERGHTAVWIPELRALLAGDMLSELELPLPALPGGVEDYLAALDLLAPVVARAEVLIPGHGTPSTRPVERLEADRRYLEAVLGGHPVEDDRLADPEMRAVHERLVQAVS